MAVVGRALLLAVGLADRAVHVEDEPGELAVPVGAVDPLAGEVHQPLQVVRVVRVSVSNRAISLVEAAVWSLARPPTTVRIGGIDAESLGVVEVLVPGQAAVDRLPQQGGEAVLSVLAGPCVLQFDRRPCR